MQVACSATEEDAAEKGVGLRNNDPAKSIATQKLTPRLKERTKNVSACRSRCQGYQEANYTECKGTV